MSGNDDSISEAVLGTDFETKLRGLERLAKSPTQQLKSADKTSKINWKDIRVEPDVFQPRGGELNEHHVGSLMKAIEDQGALDPLLVMQIGAEVFVIDGHHRLAAYRRKKFAHPIPVQWFEGSIPDAVIAAGEANTKAKLPMDSVERGNYAWRLVQSGRYSIKRTAKAAGVSPRLVCNMRDVQKRLGEEVGVYRHWWAAREAAEGRTGRPLSDDEREARVDEMAEVYAERMFKTFGTKLSANLPISARALKRYHGNRTRGLVHQLKTLTEWELDEFSDDVNSDF